VALQWERVGDGFVVKKRGWNIAYKVKEIKIRRPFAKNIKYKGNLDIFKKYIFNLQVSYSALRILYAKSVKDVLYI
jgi:hypothetical protein